MTIPSNINNGSSSSRSTTTSATTGSTTMATPLNRFFFLITDLLALNNSDNATYPATVAPYDGSVNHDDGNPHCQ